MITLISLVWTYVSSFVMWRMFNNLQSLPLTYRIKNQPLWHLKNTSWPGCNSACHIVSLINNLIYLSILILTPLAGSSHMTYYLPSPCFWTGKLPGPRILPCTSLESPISFKAQTLPPTRGPFLLPPIKITFYLQCVYLHISMLSPSMEFLFLEGQGKRHICFWIHSALLSAWHMTGT